jgi:hypothetical protein
MSMPIGQTPLFTLPLELRELVYRAVLTSPQHGPDLLRTCREIYFEAYKFIFERPVSFRSQVALFEWLQFVPQKHVDRVTELSLSVQDVDLRSLLTDSALVSHPGDPPRLLTWDLYEAELDRLLHTLKKFSNMRKLTIRAVTGRQSFLYREFLRKFLGVLGFLFPDLLDLGLEGNLHYQDLTFLSAFGRLQAFSFDGFSASSPSETATILSGLEQLTSLSLVSQSTLLTPDYQTRSTFSIRHQSLTGVVVNTIDSLKCFSVTELIPVSAPTLFFTPEILMSLQNHQGLSMIKICLSQKPNEDTMAALENFLDHTHIRTLELDWPQLDPQDLEAFSLIPYSLEYLWVRAKSAADAFDIIWSIAESRHAGELPNLIELILLRSTRDYGDVTPTINDRKDSGTGEVANQVETVSVAHCTCPWGSTDASLQMHPAFDDTDAINVIRARARLQALGVRVSWCTERQ